MSRSLGSNPCSNPGMKTTSNVSPLEPWRVITRTQEAPPSSMGSPSRALTSFRTALSARAVVLASSRHVSYHLDATGESVNRLLDRVIRFDGGDALNGLSSRPDALPCPATQRVEVRPGQDVAISEAARQKPGGNLVACARADAALGADEGANRYVVIGVDNESDQRARHATRGLVGKSPVVTELVGHTSRFEGLHYRPLQRGTWLVIAGSTGGSHPGGSHAPVLQNAS